MPPEIWELEKAWEWNLTQDLGRGVGVGEEGGGACR